MDHGQFPVQLLTTPVALALATLEYGDAVVREVALLALDGSELAPSSDWSIPGFDISPLLETLYRARESGLEFADVEVQLPAGAGGEALRRAALIDDAARLSADGVLLIPPAVPE